MKKKTIKKFPQRKSLKNKIKSKGKNLKKDLDFPVVGIGASAGGLEAFKQFFNNTPVDSGMAYVVIQHLDPNREGMLPELLQRMTKMKVVEVENGTKIAPNFVYVIPHNKSMSIVNEQLMLGVPKEGLRLPINLFFKSLALDLHERAVGVILSGMGSDGALGMVAIKEKYGLTVVQKPENAKFDSMPRSAVENVDIDIIADAKDLPEKIAKFYAGTLKNRNEHEHPTAKTSAFEKIMVILRNASENDFSLYKSNMVQRRIERRMNIHRINNMSDYVEYLHNNKGEVKMLFKEMLIGVTSFFRDPKTWELMKEKTLPKLIAKKKLLRAWVPACSTGEEAYTLAMIFTELMEETENNEKISLQIFATDLDNEAIEKARKGIFSDKIVENVSQKRLKRFFRADKNTFQISREIREMIVFAPQNVVKDPPFTNIDIISCRNLLIYMDNELQDRLISIFRYALNSGGLLLLGSAETLGNNDKDFLAIDNRHKIYQLMRQDKKAFIYTAPEQFFNPVSATKKKELAIKDKINLEDLTEQLILQQYSPAGVLVTSKGDIVHITGHTGKYLEPAAGKTNWNIFAMLREGMRGEFERAFKKILKNKKTVSISNIRVDYQKGAKAADIMLKYVGNNNAMNGMVLVLFSDTDKSFGDIMQSNDKDKKNESNACKELRFELQRAKDNLHANEEEMQTSQEELKSVNEELQSNVEELQSSNEELTTSKEEMQSLNEELQTVNSEMQSKMVIYEKVNNDMRNLMESTEIAVLFVDKKSCITQFTFSATKLYSLRQSDVGRPFTELNSDLIYPDMKKDTEEVLRSLVFIEKEIHTKTELWFRVRIMPYRTLDDHIDGLVITFTNITVLKKLEAVMKESERQGKLMHTFMDQGLALLEIITDENDSPVDYKFVDMNESYIQLFGINHETAVGIGISEVMPEAGAYWTDMIKKAVLTGEPVYYESFLETSGKYFGVYIYSPEKKQVALLVTDITKIKKEKR